MGDQDTQDETSYAGQIDQRVPEEAARAAAAIWFADAPESILSSNVRIFQRAIEAALPFLLARDYDRAFRRGVAIGRAEGEAEVLGQQVTPNDDAEFMRGVEIGRFRMMEEILNRDSGSTDYETWRDALKLAVAEGSYIDEGHGLISSDGLLARAEWFRNELNLGPRAVADAAESDPFRPDLGDVQ